MVKKNFYKRIQGVKSSFKKRSKGESKIIKEFRVFVFEQNEFLKKELRKEFRGVFGKWKKEQLEAGI